MPRKIRQLLKDYKKAGFHEDAAHRGRGSHRKMIHDSLTVNFVVSGGEGDDAKRYQEADLAAALEAVKNLEKKP